MWRVMLELLIGAAFFAPFVALPVLLFRLLRQHLPAWQVGAISGFVVCVYGLTAAMAGMILISEVVSVFYLATIFLAAAVPGLLHGLAFGEQPVPEWLYVCVPYAALFAAYVTIGAILGWLAGSLRRG